MFVVAFCLFLFQLVAVFNRNKLGFRLLNWCLQRVTTTVLCIIMSCGMNESDEDHIVVDSCCLVCFLFDQFV